MKGIRVLMASALLALFLPGAVAATPGPTIREEPAGFFALYEQAAGSQPNACYNLVASSLGASVCFGETWTTGDWPGGDLFLATNGSDVADLSNIYYGLVGSGSNDRCDDNFLVDWNDCFTDAYVKLPAGTCFRAYEDENYGGRRTFAASNWASDPGSVTKYFHFPHLVGGLNNKTSSFKLYPCD
jgi:hypothetical protein